MLHLVWCVTVQVRRVLLVPPDPVTTTLELAVSRWLEAALVTAASSATSATPAAPDHRNRGRGKVASTTHEAVRLPPSGSSSWDTRALSLHYSHTPTVNYFRYSHQTMTGLGVTATCSRTKLLTTSRSVSRVRLQVQVPWWARDTWTMATQLKLTFAFAC